VPPGLSRRLETRRLCHAAHRRSKPCRNAPLKREGDQVPAKRKSPAGRGARHQSKAHPLTAPVGPSPTPGDYPSRQATGAILCERINEPKRRGAPQRESDMRLFLSVSPYLAPLRRGFFCRPACSSTPTKLRQCVSVSASHIQPGWRHCYQTEAGRDLVTRWHVEPRKQDAPRTPG
jgi:hypothetical protein